MTIAAVTAGNVIDPTTFGNAVVDKLNGIVSGRTSSTTDGSAELAISFGVTFSAAPVVIVSAETGLAREVVLESRTTTGATVTYRQLTDGAILASTAVIVHWVAIGTLA